MTASHRWTTTSSHVTSEGWVHYQRCVCGETRMLLDSAPVRVERPDRRDAVQPSGLE
jgi:hypothetical protein